MFGQMTMEPSGGRRSKRRRSESDDVDECFPISKRINCLHIEGQNANGLGNDQGVLEAGEPHQRNVGPIGMFHTPSPHDVHGFQNFPGASSQYYEINGLGSSHQFTPVCQSSAHSQQDCHSCTPNGSHLGRYGHPTASQSQPSTSSHTVSDMSNFDPQFEDQQDCSLNDDNMNYVPELTECENPHYYHVNHVLFDAHLERIRRDGRSPEPGPSDSYF